MIVKIPREKKTLLRDLRKLYQNPDYSLAGLKHFSQLDGKKALERDIRRTHLVRFIVCTTYPLRNELATKEVYFLEITYHIIIFKFAGL